MWPSKRQFFGFRRRGALVLVCLAATFPLIGTLPSQTPAPKFDTFSVKPAPTTAPNGYSGPRTDPSRYSASRITLRSLILSAYDLKDFELVGGPGWINSDLFSVEGTTASPTDERTMRKMLQQGLVERFHLVLDRGTREGNVYSLTVAPGGPLLGKQDLSKYFAPPPLPPELAHAVIALTVNKRIYGDSGTATDIHMIQLRGTGTTTKDLAEAVSGAMSAPVNDDTGIQGSFDLALQYAADTGPQDADAPYITTALKEQLGLQLTRGHGSYTVFTVKQAERPAAN